MLRDVLREMIGLAAQRLMVLEVQRLIGAGRGERSADRLVQRNGYRERDWEAKAGSGIGSCRSFPAWPWERPA